MATYQVEVTDTFGGEANYSWVRRYEVDGSYDEPRKLVRDAKKAAGWTGLRCNTENYGDMIRITPRKACWTMFITYDDSL